jgi:phosphate:Na+ symporter
MDIISILQLLGGIGLFLFGMSQMSSSLEKLTGSGLERILERVTTSKKKGVGVVKGWGFGVGVTGIIQNSAATTIMLIGFVNAGIMKVAQAMPVVFGANVGSTVTSQILRLGDIGSDNLILQILQPSSFAPILVGIGAFIPILTKSLTFVIFTQFSFVFCFKIFGFAFEWGFICFFLFIFFGKRLFLFFVFDFNWRHLITSRITFNFC